MIPSQFDYVAAHSVDQVTQLLADNANAKILAGGMSLVPAVKARLKEPALLVDIGRISELVGVSSGLLGKLKIGAVTTHASLIDHPELAGLPIIADTARVIADLQVRNRGTIGGSLAYADPAADWTAVFLALEGEAVLKSRGKTRKVKGEDFFLSMMTSAVEEGELLTEIRFSPDGKRAGNAYVKHRQPASGLALAGVAVNLVLDRKRRIEKLSVGVTGINAVPFRAQSLRARMLGEPMPDETALRAHCEQIEEADPMEDLHGSVDYRRALLAVIARKALSLAHQRATES
ncbi:MAG: xanthine dehydrogenase family protein subunit M [Halieaceae bacterium]|jgi:aerobic carbon-monoxide dehydrogenase medium subunit|nr:xanthine dehydrogenase family protein subunit M [Halieaceae bacterium]